MPWCIFIPLLYNWSSVICSFIFQLNLIYCWKTTTLSTVLTPFRLPKADLESVNCKPKKQPPQGHGGNRGWGDLFSVTVSEVSPLNLLLCCGTYPRCPRQLHYMEQRLQIQLFNSASLMTKQGMLEKLGSWPNGTFEAWSPRVPWGPGIPGHLQNVQQQALSAMFP